MEEKTEHSKVEESITPADLYKVEFKSTLIGGYEKMDVDQYLEKVAAVFEELLRNDTEMREKLNWKSEELLEARTRENSVRDALTSAQRFSEDLLDTTRQQADTILSEANLVKEGAKAEAERLKSEAASDAHLIRGQAELEAERLSEALRNEIGALTKERNRLREDINAILTMHRALLGEVTPAEDTVEEMDEDTEAIPLLSPFDDVEESLED